MLEFRLKSYEAFKKMPMQTWGSGICQILILDDLIIKTIWINLHVAGMGVPEKIKEIRTIGIPEAERAYLAGAVAQYESEVVKQNEPRLAVI